MDEPANYPLKTIDKTVTIIEAMREKGEGSITELASALGYNKSVVHRHLSTLEQHGYVIKQGDRYELGLKYLELGGWIRKNMALYRHAEPEIEQLARDTGELANLMTEERGWGVYLKRSKGADAVDLHSYAGLHVNLHTAALGKAILAELPDAYVDEIIDKRGLPQKTSQTITDREELFAGLKTIQKQGYAKDDGEFLEGVRCVASAVTTDNGKPLGAISVSAPATRVSDEEFDEDLPKRVQSAANVVELNINY